jgi:integrase
MKHRRTPYPRYTQNFRDRHGRMRSYFRRGSVSVPLPEPHFSEAYWEAYRQCLAGEEPQARPAIGAARTKPGSVRAGFVLFVQSSAFKNDLASSTQRKYFRVLKQWVARCPDHRLGDLQPRHLAPWLDEKAQTPGAAKDWLKAMRAMFGHLASPTVNAIKVDPTAALKAPKQRYQGFHSWEEDEIETFRRHWAIGTLPRMALEIFLNTGQRRSDVVVMGRQHLRNGSIRITQQKTGQAVAIPVLPELGDVLGMLPPGNLTFLINKETGRAFSATLFGTHFRRWCDEAGLARRCSSHGLRKACGRRLAEAGCTAHEIMAILGHRSLQEAQRYTRAANREQLSESGMSKVRTRFVKPATAVLQTGP